MKIGLGLLYIIIIKIVIWRICQCWSVPALELANQLVCLNTYFTSFGHGSSKPRSRRPTELTYSETGTSTKLKAPADFISSNVGLSIFISREWPQEPDWMRSYGFCGMNHYTTEVMLKQTRLMKVTIDKLAFGFYQ
mgnify:CR=1 FL=1